MLFQSILLVGAAPSLAAILLAVCFGLFAVLWGLWTLRPWAWTWGLITFGLAVLVSLLQSALLWAGVGVVFLAYLFTQAGHYRSSDDRRTGSTSRRRA